MARGINKVILVGNLGADPDTRYMPSGKAVTNIRIATSESWKDRQTGDQQERTEWHSVVMYDKLGLARALQSEMWSIALDRFTALTGGTQDGPLRILTERAG